METIEIPLLKAKASRICLGTWAIGGWMWGGSDEEESIKTIQTAIGHGVNIIDTAPAYGFGVAEKIVGKAIKQAGIRDKVIIATKVGLQWDDKGQVFRNASPERIEKEINDSLRRLQTDYIDIYQIHWPDPLVPLDEIAETMLSLLESGKIRAIGVSNFSHHQMMEFLKKAPLSTSQPPYNLFERDIEKDVFLFTEEVGIVTLAYGSLCRGLLSGKIKADTAFSGDDLRKQDPKFQPPRIYQYLNAVAELKEFAKKKYNKSVLALAIRWVLDSGKTIALWGARHPEQLKNIPDVMDWSLDADAMAKIDQIIKSNVLDPVGPEFMAPPIA